MGGITVTRIGKTAEDVLKQVKSAVASIREMGPDSDIILLNPFTKEVHRYKQVFKKDEDGKIEDYEDYEWVENEEGDFRSGDGCAISVSSIYGDKPTEENPWVGMVHLHT